MVDRDPAGPEADPHPQIVTIIASLEGEEWEEASGWARIGSCAVPVVLAHLALVYVLATAIFEVRLPAFLHTGDVVGWLWMNGAIFGLAFWFWKKGRFPVAAGVWLQGRQARWAIFMWLGGSFALFMMPTIVRDIWNLMWRWLSGW